ncbi:BTB/POZ domain-containing protein 3 [Daldinia childiae]|uniref:BTB/POZ domain-containing protein 3 n=1 Tax=Daldinia childiae TaxID=326645 RepID=UPI001448957F|nr:BTB/POZ domain-containing protein 3 [Daldinia childiae]KAF3055034.1 BTB/POZ domain-containing protein 3 [Daldinia childiae]
MVLRKHELEAKLKDDIELVRSGVLRDENPLDLSEEFSELLEACRRGDLRRTQELISAGVNINGKDRFDYTPLIVASLCGHYELVELLIESGALAERDTFQGERCIYNALNDKIRNLLLKYDYSKSTDPLQPWAAHISALLTRDTPKTSDITLIAASKSFELHKFLLSARSPYFQGKLTEAPEIETWKLPQSIPIESFQVVLRYIYLGDIPRELVDARSGSTDEEVLTGIDKISKQLEIDKLWEAILSGSDRRLARQRHQDEVNRAQEQIQGFFQEKVLGHKMVVDTRKAHEVKWPHDNSIFADCLLRADEGGEEEDENLDKQEESNGIPIGPGAESRKQNDTKKVWKSVLYPAHKAMLIRSPYFETMFSSQFREAQTSEHLHIIKIDCQPEILELILTFLYTERSECPLELGLDLLYASDMLFLDKLKNKAAVAISTLGSGNNNVLVDRTHTHEGDETGEIEVEPINVYDVIHAAWDLRVQRLEEFAARYLAYRLEDYIDEEEFTELIHESASRLKTREETDTIELLDDIRYYLSERFRLRFEDAGLDEMMDENGEISAETAEVLAAQTNDITAEDKDAKGIVGAENPDTISANAVIAEALTGPAGVVRTLDGELVEDEFASDAINYQLLLQKIDIMLEKLKLDA